MNISPSNDARRTKVPPFDASHHDDSDDMCLKFLQSLDDEIFPFKNHFLNLQKVGQYCHTFGLNQSDHLNFAKSETILSHF